MCANKLEAYGKPTQSDNINYKVNIPAIGTDARIVRFLVAVKSDFIRLDKPILLLKCTDCRDTAKSFLKVGVDWTSRFRIQSFELTRRAHVVLVEIQINKH
jgi:hypothetical protein